MSGFYYDINPTVRMGRSQRRDIYSVADQGMDARESAMRIRKDQAITRRQYMQLGDWFPVHLPRTPVEQAGGDLFATSA